MIPHPLRWKLLPALLFLTACSIPLKSTPHLQAEPLADERTEDATVSIVSAHPDPVYADLLKPRRQGYLGSDAAHSIPLDDDTNLWLFGDTFIGRLSDDGRRAPGAAFINNCIGIHDRSSVPGSVTYHWGVTPTGDAASFFPHQEGTPGKYYWPTMGTMIGDELFIFSYSVGGGGRGFTLHGTTVIRIPNPHDPPPNWEQEAFALDLPEDLYLLSAVRVEGDELYMMGFAAPERIDGGEKGMVLARTKTADFLAGRGAEAFEYWVAGEDGPHWSGEPNNLVRLFSPSVTETNLHYDAAWDRYFCTTYNLQGEIYLTSAPELTGPWSEPKLVYQVPEFDVGFDVMTYAARPHPELATRPGEIVLTYATNAMFVVPPLFSERGAEIYHPRFVRIQLELTN